MGRIGRSSALPSEESVTGLRPPRARVTEQWATADCGAAACRDLPGGSPTGAAPHAGQLARTRRPVAQVGNGIPDDSDCVI